MTSPNYREELEKGRMGGGDGKRGHIFFINLYSPRKVKDII